MGSYIHVGLCTKISFSKTDTIEIKKNFSTIDEFKRAVEEETNLVMQHFDGQEIEDSYIFTLKSELLEPDSLLEFLNDFFAYLHFGDKKGFEFYHNELLEKVKNSKSAREIIECAEDEDDFSISFYRFGQSMYATASKTRLYIQRCQIDCVPLFYHGKTSMESTEPFFSYVERLIRVKHTQPQASVIKLFLE
jgi:hypothetical protein